MSEELKLIKRCFTLIFKRKNFDNLRNPLLRMSWLSYKIAKRKQHEDKLILKLERNLEKIGL